VVHAHPRDVMIADLAGVALRQVFGAYNIPASRLANEGVPVYPRSVLVRTPELGRAVAAAIGDSGACILRGHGIVTTGASVEQATLRALDLAELSRVSTEVALLGARPQALPDDDRQELPDLGPSFNDLSRWRHYVGRLEVSGLSL
jgi:ribulose-5-phosphate 4-epimerase/fuculose-1-phosphate aldolase